MVDKVTFAGREAYYRLEAKGAGSSSRTCTAPHERPLAAPGERVMLVLPARAPHAFDTDDEGRIEMPV